VTNTITVINSKFQHHQALYFVNPVNNCSRWRAF